MKKPPLTMIRRIVFIATITALLPGTAAAAPFLWEVRGGEQPSYIMGTVHSSHPLVRALPPAVTDALRKSRVFLPEVELSAETIGGLTAAFFDRQNPGRAKEALSPEDYDRFLRIAADLGFRESMIQNLAFEMIPLVLAQPPGEDFTHVMDVQLYRLATRHGLSVVPLEKPEEQLRIFRELDTDTTLRLIGQALDEAEQGYPSFRKLIRLYASGNKEEIHAYLRSSEKDLPEAFARALIDRRNEIMVERARPHLEKGGAFIAVGLAHLLGERGIISALKAGGYSVKRVGER